MKRLNDKVALITGATGGIGEATVRRFLDEGARVTAVGRSAEKLAGLASDIDGGDQLATFVAAADDEAATAASVAATVDRFGGLDVVFANAGTEGVVKPLTESTMAEFKDVLNTNVLGVWLDMKYAVPEMRKRGGGSIIATASVAGLVGFPALMPYIASKHAVCGMVKTAALELGPENIRVNAVAPGPIDNRMIHSLEQQLSPDDPAAVVDQMIAAISMARYGSNDEVANVVLFLASDDSSFVNGAVYTVDGGYTAA